MDLFMLNRTICRLPEVMARTGLSRSTIYDLIRKGKFPSQVNLGPRAVGWVENEIVDWIEARIDETRAREYRTT
jgi:prophage regulatory protein